MKKATIKYLAIALMASLIGFSSCHTSNHDCIWGNNDFVSETRTPEEDFDGIISQGSFKVYVTLDSIDEIRVDAEENLLPYIYTKVDGNDLVLKYRDNRCVKTNYTVKIYVKTTNLVFVSLEGSGLIKCDSVSTPSFEASLTGSGDLDLTVYAAYLKSEISGSGDVKLKGSATESDMNISGSGKIEAFDFDMDKCFSNISGSGDMFVTVSNLLDVNITGSGDVFYQGNPVLNVSVTGSGSVLHY